MSNIAGKAYAMNVVTPVCWYWALFNRFIFWIVSTRFGKRFTKGLTTLSLIHYARWVIVKPSKFPHFDKEQPKETIKYSYMFFFSNFNGSWNQYVDSFHMSISGGLNMFWRKNVKYPGSVPLQPFHNYISYNQIWTNHYYNAYPMAASNDVKAAKRIKTELVEFIADVENETSTGFKEKYEMLLNSLQNDLSLMAPTPIVSLAAAAISSRRQPKKKPPQSNSNTENAPINSGQILPNNTSGKAHGLTLLCPIVNGSQDDESYAEMLGNYLEILPVDGESPMAKVPNTYFARFYVLNDVYYEAYPAEEEHLKSKYLVFSSNFYGDLDTYLKGMWDAAEEDVKEIWQHCVAFDKVHTAEDFIVYIKKCQVDNNLFFNGSTDDPLVEQLKSLYLKQELTRFAYANQELNAKDLQNTFQSFVKKTEPSNLSEPSWFPGLTLAAS